MRYLYTLLLWLLVVCSLSAQVPAVSFSPPLVITKGGIYTGNYRSLDSKTPAVTVATSEPVTLSRCVLAGAGDLIKSFGFANLTVINCSGYGLPPSIDNVPRGRFLNAYNARRLVVQHNYMEATSGMLVDRWSGNEVPSQQQLLIQYNKGLNCDKRYRNGGFGDHRAFLMLNTVRSVPDVDISYNEFINRPNESLVEDNINIFKSSGTKNSPLKIHDNYVQGAYPYPATATSYTGSGLTFDGESREEGRPATAATVPAYAAAYQNQFVSTCNAAMNIANGHDIHLYDNRVVTSGLLPDGSQLRSTFAACCIFNGSNLGSDVFYGNTIGNNLIGFTRRGYKWPYPDRHDQDVVTGKNLMPLNTNQHFPNAPITLADERHEWDLWQSKLKAAGITVGVEPNKPLPVELTCFVVQVVRKQALVSWQTATERNSHYFEVQQAGEDGVFTPAITIPAAGISQAARAYEVAIPLPEQDSYWRLKMVDLDRSTTYSQVVAITAQPQSRPVRQELWSMLGGRLWVRPWQDVADLVGVAPGLYVLVSVYADGSRLTEKVAVR